MTMEKLASFKSKTQKPMELIGKTVTIALVAFCAGALLLTPVPVFLREEIESFLQYGSAQIASWLFRISGTPAVCNGIVLELPAGLILRVAPECSGLNSTLALFVTSLLASNLFLHTLVSRALLSAFVIPLAILRNGFRIFVIGQLCVHIGPEMITSDIHRHGGPVFFVLSLIPLFAVLVFLRKANPQKMQYEKLHTNYCPHHSCR